MECFCDFECFCHPQGFLRIAVLKNFVKFSGKYIEPYLQAQAYNFIENRTPLQLFYEFYGIFQNNFGSKPSGDCFCKSAVK